MARKTRRSAKEDPASEPEKEEVVENEEEEEEEVAEEDQQEEKDEDEDEDEDEEEEGEGEGEGDDDDDEDDDDQDDDDQDDEDDEDDSDSDSDEDEADEHKEAKPDFKSDLGHLAAFNVAPVNPKKVSSGACAHLRELATENVKLMFRDLLALPGVDGSVSIKELPEPVFRLPRHKPAPKPKAETRWDKYAHEQGIQKRKRDRMVWDESTQTWAPRWGYKRANDEMKDWVIEYNDQDGDTTDKFMDRRKAKKMRVLKNRQKYLRNLENAKGGDVGARHAVENLNVDGARAGASKRGKAKVVDSLKVAQVSTASLGRFDPHMQGEGERKLTTSKKRKFLPSQSTSDLDRDKKILGRLLGKHLGGSSADTDAAPAKGKGKGKKRRGKR